MDPTTMSIVITNRAGCTVMKEITIPAKRLSDQEMNEVLWWVGQVLKAHYALIGK